LLRLDLPLYLSGAPVNYSCAVKSASPTAEPVIAFVKNHRSDGQQKNNPNNERAVFSMIQSRPATFFRVSGEFEFRLIDSARERRVSQWRREIGL
jgi:hypothetical protein